MRTVLTSLVVWQACAACLWAQQPTPFPELTSDRVYVADVPDDYAAVRARIAELEPTSKQRYFVVVVRSTGAGQWATRDYAFNLHTAWTSEAKRKNLPYPSDRSVLIVVAIENRELSLLAGERLQSDYDLRGDDVDVKLVQPRFIPHAKQNQIDRGLIELLDGVEAWVAEAETRRQQEAREQQALEEQLIRDAHETVQTALDLVATARQELAEKRQAGFQVADRAAEIGPAEQHAAAGRVKLVEAEPPEPDAAANHARIAIEALKPCVEALRQLPVQKAEAIERIAALETLADATEDNADQARRDGFDPANALRQLQDARQQLENARTDAPSNPRLALAAIPQAEQEIQAARTAIDQLPESTRRQAASRRFRSVTLPLIVLGSVAAIVGLILALARWMHNRARRAFVQEWEQFKERLISVRERLDGLQERHRLLPFSDLDYQEPMSGATQSLYDEVQGALARFRQRWLELMEVRQEVEAQAESEKPLARRKLQAARQAMTKAAPEKLLPVIDQECVAPLTRLEEAHEQARSATAALEADLQKAGEQVQAISAAGLPPGPYQAQRDGCAAQLETARGQIAVDPVGAVQAVDAIRQSVASMVDRAARVLALHGETQDAARRLDEASAAASEKRSAGMLLSEPDGNPDPHYAAAREQLQAIRPLLDHADPDSAQRMLDQAKAGIDQGLKAVERHVTARAYCEQQFAEHASRVQALRQLAISAEAEQRELSRFFSPDSYSAVANHCQQAQTLLDAFPKRFDEAQRLAAPDKQHYFRAAALVVDAANEEQSITRLFTAIGARLAELRQLRQACQTELENLRQRADQVGQLLAGSTADRPRSSQRYRAALEVLNRLRSAADESIADWPRIATQAGEVASDLTRAEQSAQEDMRLAQQAAAEVAETEREIARARSFYQSGVAANVSAAEAGLAQARASLSAQEYERAIEQANLAEAEARRGYDEAVRQVRLKDERAQQQRMLQAQPAARSGMRGVDMLTTAAAVINVIDALAGAARTASAASHGPSSSPSPAPAPSGNRSGASQSSWSAPASSSPSAASGASQSKW